MIACVRARDWQAAHDFLLQLENEPPAEGEATFALESTATLVRIRREEGLPMDEVLLGDMMLAGFPFGQVCRAGHPANGKMGAERPRTRQRAVPTPWRAK